MRPELGRSAMRGWWTGRLLLATLCIWLGAGRHADADLDTCAVDGQPVLLYKIIQWWHDAPATQAPWICGRTLACRTRAPLRVTYLPSVRRLTLHIEAGFAELVWPELGGKKGVSTRFDPVRIDPAYLDRGVVIFGTDAETDGDPARLCLEGVRPQQAKQWIRMAAGLELLLAGPVRGLADSRIALVDSPALDKACPQRASGRASPGSTSRAMTLTLRHRPTDRVLAIFASESAGG
jgi:hypothetical protein